jgi:hypothetical protein
MATCTQCGAATADTYTPSGDLVCRSCAARVTVSAANAQMSAGKRGGRIGSVISVTLGLVILAACAFVWSRPGAFDEAMHSGKFGKMLFASGPLLGVALVVNGARNWARSR